MRSYKYYVIYTILHDTKILFQDSATQPVTIEATPIKSGSSIIHWNQDFTQQTSGLKVYHIRWLRHKFTFILSFITASNKMIYSFEPK